MEINKRAIGNAGEDIVSAYLIKNNITILDRNFSSKHGEIDIIGMDGDYLVFFEVKYRKDLKYGYPLEAVTKAKQKHIIKAAQYYLYYYHYPEDTFIRFDCIGILDNEIEWVKNSFGI